VETSPGVYQTVSQQLDGVAFSPKEGETLVGSLLDFSARSVARIKPPTPGELPPADCAPNFSPNASPAWKTRWQISFPIYHSPAEKNPQDPSDSIDVSSEIDVGVAGSGAKYRLQHCLWAQPVDVPLGQQGAGPRSFQLGVLDVADVLVNQAQPRVAGSWDVFYADVNGNRAGGAFLTNSVPTGHSVPMPSGHYRVEVYYNTVEAGQKTDVHIIDI
jgi:hypothetical protein